MTKAEFAFMTPDHLTAITLADARAARERHGGTFELLSAVTWEAPVWIRILSAIPATYRPSGRGLAKAVGCSPNTAHTTLQILEAMGAVKRHSVGTAYHWTLTPAAVKFLEAREG